MPADEAWLSRLRVEPLDRGKHDRAAFSCGVDRLDNFIKRTAANQADEDFTKVYVAIEPPSNQVLGYYSLSAHVIDVESLPESDRKRMPRYPTIPAIYLSMIAVNAAVQGRGLGTFLVAEAFKICVSVADKIGSYFIVLDALNNDAARLYRRLGFQDLPAPGRETRMLMAMAKVRKAIVMAAR
jgi:ribosomal protein S18 acetylase RimI-like enzyme